MKKRGFTVIEVLCVVAILLILAAVIGGSITGCDGSAAVPNADKQMAAQTRQAMNEANQQIGMPSIKNFQERKLAKMIFELRDQEDLTTYAYIVNHMTGELVYIGRCIGFGLPYSVQYTNPEKVAHKSTYQGGSFGTMPQADPNGLFMPEGLSATWLMMVDEATGEARPVYVEPQIIVSPFKLGA